MIKLENITKKYTRNSEFSAVDNINLEINMGDFIVIIGKSGSGKSTLLNLICGVLKATSGKIIFDGVDISTKSDDEKSEIRNKYFGYIPQQAITLDNLTVIDNICLPSFINDENNDCYGRGRFLLNELGIKNLENSYSRELSGGELKRTMIARALMNYPKIILADEPTSDLDKINTKEVLEILKKENKENNTTIIMVTHDLACLEYADIVYTMESGKLSFGNNL